MLECELAVEFSSPKSGLYPKIEMGCEREGVGGF